jgi:putative CocE/NonD family hydrolase
VHLTPYTVPARTAGEHDFGPQAEVNVHELGLKWFDYWLKGAPNGVMEEPPVRIFVMGENVWRDEQEWPPARATKVRYYLHSQGQANTLNGNGRLSEIRPAEEPPDRFVYDPQNPVPTRGGAVLSLPAGVYDQREVENRPDVLVYTSDVLEHAVEVTGNITVRLYASSSAQDTDFTAKLVDVHPDGYARNLRDGIVRARYRESKTRPRLMEPGRVYEFSIDLWATSNVFLPGHRIRLEISSSNFPWFDRNQNTGHPLFQDAQLRSAEQRVYHSGEHASYVELPVIGK